MWLYAGATLADPPIVSLLERGCTTTAGHMPRAEGVGRGDIGSSFTLRMWALDPNVGVNLDAGFVRSTTLDLSFVGLRNCLWYVDPIVTLNSVTDGSGRVLTPIPVANDPRLVGIEVWFQMAALSVRNNASNIAYSNAVRLVIGRQ
ncbi:MAG: hypothetical protein IPM29_02875 [Planctomycetes bacterium]|nr:hypothetical protein [Planctomycetota bacterium]